MLIGKEIGVTDAVLIGVAGIFVVILELAIIAVLIVLLSRVIKLLLNNNKNAVHDAPSPVSNTVSGSAAQLPQNQSAGELKLTNVDDKTAAMIMAIVSNESGIPLNRLSFRSIKQV